MKRLYNLCIFFVSILLVSSVFTGRMYAQVSNNNKVKLIGKERFNYPQTRDIDINFKKSRVARIVFADRDCCQSYDDPYFQRKRTSYPLGTPYYIIGERNGNYKLVLAEKDIIGRPKSILGFLYSRRRHFKEADKVKFVGWIPKDNILMYDHAHISSTNNRPIRYRVGINSINRLLNFHQYFNGDTLKMYSDPFMKTILKCSVTTGEIVYVYKLDKTGKSALISDSPALSDTTMSAFGWVPADLLAEVGQNDSYKIDGLCYHDSLHVKKINGKATDTIFFSTENIQSPILFNLNGNVNTTDYDSVYANLPFSVWDIKSNKILNIKGGDIMSYDIKKIATDSKHVNLHILFYDMDRHAIKQYISVLQNLKLKLRPEYKYKFSAINISSQGHNRYLPSTSSFASWLNFMKESTTSKTYGKESAYSGFSGAIKQISYNNLGKQFDNNIFVILGTRQSLEISTKELSYLASKTNRLLFFQIEKNSEKPYQEFLLQAKSILDVHATDYVNYISNYIADNKFIKYELFRIHEAPDANIYLYDAPNNSLNVGGLVFPKGSNPLDGTAFETAIDSVMKQSYIMDSLLISSLKKYESQIGVLRSHLSPELRTFLYQKLDIAGNTAMTGVSRNSINDVYYTKAVVSDSVITEDAQGFLFNDNEIRELLRQYRELLPEFSDTIGKRELKLLRKLYKRQIKNTNILLGRLAIHKKSSISDMFYYKTGIAVNDSVFHSVKVNNLRQNKIDKKDFNKAYNFLIGKMKNLEDMYKQNLLEPVIIAGKKYYFIVKQKTL